MNEREKLIIDQLKYRMETHPDEYMLYKGIPYKPAQMIDEIKRGTKVGKELVREMTNRYWEDKLEKLPIAGYKVKKSP